jgi:glycosyltransferase involved in cell wall biosynthesis
VSKIALIVPGGVDRSGTQRVVPALLWLIERLAHQHELHVFALRQERRASSYPLLGATVHNVGWGWPRSRALLQIVREHARGPIDLFHAVWVAAPGLIAVVAGKALRRPAVLHIAGGELVTLDDIGYGGRRTRRGRLQVASALRGATRITVPSEPMREAAAALGYAAQRLPLGVDRERWPARPPRPRDPSHAARLIHVASLNRVKDQATLLRALAHLRAQRVEFLLDVVGVDTLGGEVQRMAAALDLVGCIEFHGFLTQDRLRPLVERADLMLISSRHEAGPVVVLEAGLAGVPTVGTAVGHVDEWAPGAAVAVPVGNAARLAAETAALLADEGRRQRLAAAAQARALREDADWTAREVLQIYADLMG